MFSRFSLCSVTPLFVCSLFTHTHTHTVSESGNVSLVCREKQLAKTLGAWGLRHAFVVLPQTHTYMRNLEELHPHNYLCGEVSPDTYVHTCTVGVYAHTLTQSFNQMEAEINKKAGYCQMACIMCVITALVGFFVVFFLICEVALRACQHVCLFSAYMCGRLVLPFCFFSVFFTSTAVGWLSRPWAKDLVYHQAWLCEKSHRQTADLTLACHNWEDL